MTDRRSDRAVRPETLLRAAALVFPVLIAVLIVRDGVDVPTHDDWTRLPLLVKKHAGTLSLADLFAPLNEHRLLFPNALFVMLAGVTSWNVKYEMAATLALAALALLNLGLLGASTLGGTKTARSAALLLTSMLIFGPIQTDTWLWGIQTAVVMPIAATTGCILLAQSRWRQRWRLPLCLLLAVVATFSFGSGLLCWLVVLPIFVLEASEGREGRSSVAVWALGAALAGAVYFSGYHPKAAAPALEPPARMLGFFLRFLGNPLTPRDGPIDPMRTALLVGGLEVALFAGACGYLAWRRDPPLARRMVPWISLALFAALGATLVTLARMAVDTSLATRYATTAVLMPVALVHLAVLVGADAGARGVLTPFARRSLVAVLLATLVPLHIAASRGGIETASHWRESRRAGKAALLYFNLFRDEELLSIAFQFRAVEANTLDGLGYLRPGLVTRDAAGKLPGASGGGRADADRPCGVLERADRNAAEGWAISPGGRAQADAVLLAFDGGAGRRTPFAVARVGLDASAFSSGAGRAPRTSGWRKVFPGKVPTTATRLFAWALDTDSGITCALTTPAGEGYLELPGPGRPVDSVGVMTPLANGSVFSLRNSNTAGPADVSFLFGEPTDVPVAGDWDGDGRVTIGVYRPREMTFYLRNSNAPGPADVIIPYGMRGDLPVAGDWDGDGVTTIGVYRPSDHVFYLRNANRPGAADLVVPFGDTGDVPIVGNWSGGRTTIGVYRPRDRAFYLRNTNAPGPADATAPWGIPGDLPVAGDFDGRGRATIGVYRPSEGAFHLSNAAGTEDLVVGFGARGFYRRPGGLPIIGHWGGP